MGSSAGASGCSSLLLKSGRECVGPFRSAVGGRLPGGSVMIVGDGKEIDRNVDIVAKVCDRVARVRRTGFRDVRDATWISVGRTADAAFAE